MTDGASTRTIVRKTALIPVIRGVTTAAAVLALTATAAPGLAYALPSPGTPATASPGERDGVPALPDGWRLSGSGAERQLIWTADTKVPMGDARVEFRSGGRLLGHPVAAPDGRTFRLALDGRRIGDGAELSVNAAGRRLDAADGDGDGARSRSPRGIRPTAPAARPEAQPPANAVDPGTPGTYRTARSDYSLKSVKLPGFPEAVEMQAAVVAPVDAPGKRPVALFLHGRHGTCYKPGTDQDSGDWPCKPGWKPIPSHLGYLKAQQLLASQGYVTLSIAANGINGQDHQAEDGGAQARSSLVRQHLGRWADWGVRGQNAPAAVRKAAAAADLSRVLLVGHSRGGEGVNRAAMDSLYAPPAAQDGYRGPVRWKIRGNVLIGPTVFGQNPVADVPSMTVLPGCDGDVSDLQGQIYLDGTRGVSNGTALHSAVYVVGANHNFFNSEWTPGQSQAPSTDDFWSSDEERDAVCSPGTRTRLTAPQQQTAGATYIAAAARLFVGGDDKVRPLLDGTGRRAPSAGPVQVLTHAVGGNRTGAFTPGAGTTVTGTGGRICAQVDADPARSCLPEDGTAGRSPHFSYWEISPEPGRDALALKWSRAGAPAGLRSARPVSLAGSESLALRVIVPPNSKGTELDVTVADASGRRATLGTVRVDGLPGTERTASHWAREVRVPLAPATRARLDLKKLTALDLTPRTASGQAWLMDAWGWRPGTPAVRVSAMPRVDLGRLTVDEGDSGVRTYRVPVRVSGQGSGQVRLFLPKPDSEGYTPKLVTVRPGQTDIAIPVQVKGNTRYGWDVTVDALVKAVRGTVVGSHRGGVTARNDDKMPEVKLTPVATDVTEGEALVWQVTLSEAADADIMGGVLFQPVTGGTELNTADLDPDFVRDTYGSLPDPPRPLSQPEYPDSYLAFNVAAGESATEIRVPTVKDGVAEPVESLLGRTFHYDGDWKQVPGQEVTGTVKDAS
ncbi:hypothetical protein [Streptomyces sp. NPDC090025]|uniref:hypothetical protein n=1 Tax=Streptomyces sp. NPDC090025 TaxID=3365922 RepID=UPI0038371EC8